MDENYNLVRVERRVYADEFWVEKSVKGGGIIHTVF